MAMVTDFLIGFLLLLSAVINILALSAFLATPSLRSTSNRFVINLLIVNVIGCIILAPSLLFNSNVIRSLYSAEEINTQTASVVIQSTPAHSTTLPTTITTSAFNKSSMQSAETTTLFAESESVGNNNYSTIYRTDSRLQSQWSAKPTAPRATVPRTTMEDNETSYHQMRPWILDIIAAIGALSLVLVVGDTYVGVTDPLRYHTRVSASRVCLLIVVVWCSALGFGITSAFRGGRLQMATGGSDKQMRQTTLYDTAFRWAYFICIIFVPFTLVCAMYWGIIREARKNGLRLRHNGSSPLLQSVLHIGGAQCHDKRDGHHEEAVIVGAAAVDHCRPRGSVECSAISNPHNPKSSLALERSSLRRNKSAQYLACPTCESCEQVLLTRSVSNQSAYLNSSHLTLPNRDHLRAARSSPDLQQQLLLADHMVEHTRTPRRSTKSLGYMTSIRHRLSNASSLFKYREESRAARISILVVIMFLISYIPFGLLVLVEGHDNSFLTTYQQTVLAIFFVVLANIISPLIFAYRNKRVRRGIKRLVSSPGRATCPPKEDRFRGGGNNSSVNEKELSDRSALRCHRLQPTNTAKHRNCHHRVDKGHRHKSPLVDVPVHRSLLPDYNALLSSSSSPPVLDSVQKRKLVIFNGRSGQITKVYHPDQHHHRYKCATGTQWSTKGCNKDKLLAHKNSCRWSRNDIGAPMSVSALRAGSKPNQKATKIGVLPTPADEPILQRLRITSSNLFRKSRARTPQVSHLDYPTKAIDV